jgi:hypothetical protein
MSMPAPICTLLPVLGPRLIGTRIGFRTLISLTTSCDIDRSEEGNGDSILETSNTELEPGRESESDGVPNAEGEGKEPRAERFISCVAFRASRISDAEEPPLKRCSRGEESELDAQAGGWKEGLGRGGALVREGSAQPREPVREVRSSADFRGGGEDSKGLGLYGAASEEVDSASGEGGGEEVVGWGFIAVLGGVVDRDRVE